MAQRDFMRPGRSVAVAKHAMAATSHPLATLAAIDILRAGGNAVDAAIAAVALQGVIDPHMTGIGGDCFAIYAPAQGNPTCINGSGRTPAKASLKALLAAGAAKVPDLSAHAVVIPGAVDAWCLLNAQHGRLPLSDVLAPAIAAAERGFVATPRVAQDWTVYADRLKPHAAAAAHFLPQDRPLAIGQSLASPALAATLTRIGKEGREAFYSGPVAEDMVSVLQAAGGTHDRADFSSHSSVVSTPLSANYRGYQLLECPPNGQGLTALIMARLLERFDLSDPALGEADRIHLLAEATKAAYRLRDSYIGDPASMTVSPNELLSDATISALHAGISMHEASPLADFDFPLHRDTVYVSVVDEDGNAISLINSVFMAFGSGIYAARSGVLFNNRGAGFSLEPDHPNLYGPSKLPLHTIIPAILRKGGRTVMSFGVMGGQYQAVGHTHMMSQIIDQGLDVQQASDRPRSFYTDGAITLEPTIDDWVRLELESRGHRTRWADEPLGGCQAIWIDRGNGLLWGASDHRKDGIALGY
ncbi:gamma-glutamyltransferase family protein [Devosia naphthalenivorans]|uniref:gamma-glutamyltransferase family protein n=1 Tax=Devosia naphthalenivorans TaxID=2082392 RepID=UPI000D357E06|nr:gamma-glutamyltransferase family protein [Devosia naphthalenivorans]